MKICFLLQRRFAYIGHKIAVILKEKYGVEEFCAYVSQRSSFEFLKNQTDIAYTSLLLDEEIHKSYKNEKIDLDYLKMLEREYGVPNLWPYIAIDRVVMQNLLVREYPHDNPPYTHEEMMKIFQVKAKAIIDFFEKGKPDVVFSTVIAAVGSMLLYYVAKKKGVKFILADPTRIGGGWTLTDDYKKFSHAEKVFDELITNHKKSEKIQDARKYIEDFRKKPTTYLHYSLDDANRNFRLRPLKWFLPKHLWRSLRWFTKLLLAYLTGKKSDYTDEKPMGSLIDKIRRKIRTAIGFNDLYDEPDFKEDFAFFPLHFEPEISLFLYAPFWKDQINLIKQIAISLPLHFKLYVKEHPAMVGYRPHSYYRQLKKIPNVKLINPYIKSYDIIKQARLVVVLSGTVGWEAILLKKPLVTFGDVFYNKFSVVKKCEKIEELPYIIKNQLENFKHNEEELENFIGAIMEESADVGLGEIWDRGTEPQTEKKRLTLLADLIAKKLNLKPLTD